MIARDVRFTLRLLARNRSFAVAALAVIALGIGPTTAVFTVVRSVLLQPLPYRDPERLVLFRADLVGYSHQPALTSEEMVALRERSDLFESVAVVNDSEGNLTSPDDMQAVSAASVSDNFLETLGVTPLLGRSVSYSNLNVVVRGRNAAGLMPAVERAVQSMGPGRPVHDIRTLDEYVADASADTRFALFVLGAFAVLALVLTAIGVYGVVAYATARRTREIAVRIALGADSSRIVALVVRDGLMWTMAGLLGGVAGAFALSRYLSSLLFNVGERDPITFVAVALLLATVALVATAVPALKAVRVDPMLALRSE